MRVWLLRSATIITAALAGLPLACATAAAASTCEPGPRHLLWGDLHVHTAFSLDAYVLGTRRTPADAYRFARGAPDTLADGTEIRLDRPLDFAAVTDHAEYLAATTLCGGGDTSPYCRAVETASAGTPSLTDFRRLFSSHLSAGQPICPGDDPARCRSASGSAWQRIQHAADAANDPCRFTAFIGNEWSATPNLLHWHRNLIFESSRVPAAPPNVIDQPTQEALWATLERTCRPEDGCDVVAIPHNGNIGMGGTFRIDESDRASLERRARFERLAEVFQHKGQSECFPGSPVADEACNFEVVLPTPVRRRQAQQPGPLTADEASKTASGYLRDTLGRGLAVAARTGVNPFRYGLIGSTDTHDARPGYVQEDGWAGTFGRYDDTRAKRLANTPYYNPGGLVAVWAESNTRASIFAALKRREVYATSGPRIALRFQQTFDAEQPLCNGPAPGAVVMGGTLGAGDGKPRFAVQAMMDRRPLARIDIVRLVYRNGEVAVNVVSDDDGATSAARSQRCFVWRDDDYHPGEPALWYARVLEVPGPRWSAGGSDKVPDTIQERAWSSPIWSTPD